MKNSKLKDYRFMSQRQRMSPFPNYMSMESVCKEMKKYTGSAIDNLIFFFEGNLMNGFEDYVSYNRVSSGLAKKINQDLNFPKKLTLKQKQFGKELVNFTKLANKKVNGKTSNKELYNFFAGYEKRYKAVYATYGWIWNVEEKFSGQLLDIVQKRVGQNSSKSIDVLNILTQEPTAMVAMTERKALLELALKININKNWQSFVLSQQIEKIKQDKILKKLISQHEKDYFWVTRDYEDPVLTFESIVVRLSELLKLNVSKEYDLLINKIKATKTSQENYFKEFNFSIAERKLFAAMREMAYLKELRKTYVSQSLYYFDKVLEEIGKRLFLSIKQVRFFTTSDVKAALLQNKDLTTEINNRIKLSLWLFDKNKTQIITGAPAEKLFKQFCQFQETQIEFYGMPVSPGKASGPARIIMNPDEIGKVQKGDIIVSVQVVPSFSTGIMKAAGLICDGGHGVTTHPATLAREAQIPCVIQTRFFRKVVKDGDIVEVDGYKGIARIIKKK